MSESKAIQAGDEKGKADRSEEARHASSSSVNLNVSSIISGAVAGVTLFSFLPIPILGSAVGAVIGAVVAGAARQQVTERAIKELVERVWHGKCESAENKEQHSSNQAPK